jgi:anti-anti-sigma factor
MTCLVMIEGPETSHGGKPVIARSWYAIQESIRAEVEDVGVERVLAAGSGKSTGEGEEKPRLARLGGPVGLADWRGDVALELWVETDALPPRVRLAGRLDSTTVANLTQVVCELLAGGSREVELCTDGLRVIDSSAVGALADIEQLVRSEGGTLVRVGPAIGPFGRARRGSTPSVGRS